VEAEHSGRVVRPGVLARARASASDRAKSSKSSTTGCCAPTRHRTTPAPLPIRKALHTIDIHITETIDHARLLPKSASKLKTTVKRPSDQGPLGMP
jgi:hypothetical protein